MRPGAGRPAKRPDEKQGRYVTIALTDAEYAALREAAAAEEPIATVARRLVLRALARRKK